MHLVKCEGRSHPATVEHKNVEAAHHEALRLAALNPGVPFYVYAPVEVVIKPHGDNRVHTMPCKQDGDVSPVAAMHHQTQPVPIGLSLPVTPR